MVVVLDFDLLGTGLQAQISKHVLKFYACSANCTRAIGLFCNLTSTERFSLDHTFKKFYA